MIFLMSKICRSHGIAAYERIFSESEHGKGAPDGVGATVKRIADNFVALQRHWIQSAKDIIPLLTTSKINASIVSTSIRNVGPSLISNALISIQHSTVGRAYNFQIIFSGHESGNRLNDEDAGQCAVSANAGDQQSPPRRI